MAPLPTQSTSALKETTGTTTAAEEKQKEPKIWKEDIYQPYYLQQESKALSFTLNRKDLPKLFGTDTDTLQASPWHMTIN